MIRLSNHTEDEIPIVFTGLRPGEKLFEEIGVSGEECQATPHPQILITNPPQPAHATPALWLRKAAATQTPEDVMSRLHDLIPEYVAKDHSTDADDQRTTMATMAVGRVEVPAT
jgi:FlaA1/EpsC-like NDP-sugar epimerase